jgi:thiamine pyridinylase
MHFSKLMTAFLLAFGFLNASSSMAQATPPTQQEKLVDPCSPQANGPRRQLRVVLYPFIPEYKAAEELVKREFEASHPKTELVLVDLASNYYASGDNYVGSACADIYELDSVFLAEFVQNHKIKELPDEVLLPQGDLLTNADHGSRVDGKRYGAAHWVCRDFLFFKKDEKPVHPNTLSALKAFIGPKHEPDSGLLIDLKGKSTLGELYLLSAYDTYHDWSVVEPKTQVFDKSLERGLLDLKNLCDARFCRDQILHEVTGIYGQEFARKRGKALVGYSELLHSVLLESQQCGKTCLSDAEIEVDDFNISDSPSSPVSWVDSFTVSTHCEDSCWADAADFIRMMNSDEMYMKLLLPSSALSFEKAPTPPIPVPAYLLPAKSSLYSNKLLLSQAHLYPRLRSLVENAAVPSASQLNEHLRKIGATIDADLETIQPPH